MSSDITQVKWARKCFFGPICEILGTLTIAGAHADVLTVLVDPAVLNSLQLQRLNFAYMQEALLSQLPQAHPSVGDRGQDSHAAFFWQEERFKINTAMNVPGEQPGLDPPALPRTTAQQWGPQARKAKESPERDAQHRNRHCTKHLCTLQAGHARIFRDVLPDTFRSIPLGGNAEIQLRSAAEEQT